MLQEVVNELSRLYRLQNEGKEVSTLINELEGKLMPLCDEKVDTEKANEEDN